MEQLKSNVNFREVEGGPKGDLSLSSWKDYYPTKDYLLVGKPKTDQQNRGVLSSGIITEKLGFFGIEPCAIVLKAGPDSAIPVGAIVDFTKGFWLEDEYAATKVRPNMYLHQIHLLEGEFGLVSSGQVIGIRGIVDITEEEEEVNGEYLRFDFAKMRVTVSESKEAYEAGKFKRHVSIFGQKREMIGKPK